MKNCFLLLVLITTLILQAVETESKLDNISQLKLKIFHKSSQSSSSWSTLPYSKCSFFLFSVTKVVLYKSLSLQSKYTDVLMKVKCYLLISGVLKDVR